MPSGIIGGSSVGNAPELSITPTGLVNDRRAITSAGQAMEVVNTMEYDARKLIARAARISAKLTGEPPHKVGVLKSQGKDYFSNIPVRYLETVINRIVPRLYMRLKAVPYLTMSKLPDETPDGGKKTEIARRIVTEAIRSWPEWNFFIQGLFKEPVTYGYAFVAWFDSADWKPRVIRMDRGFVPFGTKVGVDDIPHFSARWDYQPHELVEMIRDVESAAAQGWNVENVVKAVNAARPPAAGNTWDEMRTFDDLIRESAAQLSWRRGTNIIETRHLFSKEIDGKVSHRILSVQTGDELYVHEDRFDSMAQVVCPFVFEYGNGNIHGSYGIGQRLYDIAVQYEKAFNRMNDNARARARLTMLVPNEQNVNTVKLRVTDEYTMVTGREVTIQNAATPSVTEEFSKLMDAFRQITEEIVGAYMPPLTNQADVSAAAVNVAALRQEEIYQSVLDNLLTQFAWMMREMTRRLLDPQTDDPIAQEAQRRIAGYLNPEEIAAFANSPASYVSIDVSNQKEKEVDKINYLQSKVGDPQFNQRAVKEAQAIAALGKELADQVLLPDEDPTVEAEQSRQQLIENNNIGQGTQMPVSTRDNDDIHIKVLQPQMEQWLQMGAVQPARLGLMHMAAHYESGVQKRVINEPDINNLKGYIADFEKRLQEAEGALMAQQQAMAPAPMIPEQPQAQIGTV